MIFTLLALVFDLRSLHTLTLHIYLPICFFVFLFVCSFVYHSCDTPSYTFFIFFLAVFLLLYLLSLLHLPTSLLFTKQLLPFSLQTRSLYLFLLRYFKHNLTILIVPLSLLSSQELGGVLMKFIAQTTTPTLILSP